MHTHPWLRNTATLYRALSNERRLAILFLLANHSLTCEEIAAKFHIHKAAASRHLHILLRAGLILGNRKGKYVHFSLCRRVWPQALLVFAQQFIRH